MTSEAGQSSSFISCKVTRENLSCATGSLTTERLALEFRPRAFQINMLSQFIDYRFLRPRKATATRHPVAPTHQLPPLLVRNLAVAHQGSHTATRRGCPRTYPQTAGTKMYPVQHWWAPFLGFHENVLRLNRRLRGPMPGFSCKPLAAPDSHRFWRGARTTARWWSSDHRRGHVPADIHCKVRDDLPNRHASISLDMEWQRGERSPRGVYIAPGWGRVQTNPRLMQ